jgi:hypothetical protein
MQSDVVAGNVGVFAGDQITMVGPPWQIIEEGESDIPVNLQEFRGGHGHVGAGAGMLVQMQMPDEM